MGLTGKSIILFTVTLELIYVPFFLISVNFGFVYKYEFLPDILMAYAGLVMLTGLLSIIICINDIRKRDLNDRSGWYLYIVLVSWLSVPHYFFKYVFRKS